MSPVAGQTWCTACPPDGQCATCAAEDARLVALGLLRPVAPAKGKS